MADIVRSQTNIQKKVAIKLYDLGWVGSATLFKNIEGKRIRGKKNRRRRERDQKGAAHFKTEFNPNH